MRIAIDADLSVVLERAETEPVTMRLVGRDNRLVLDVDEPGAFAGAGDASAIRGLAEALGVRDVVIEVVSGGERLVRIGAVSAPWWQRRLTGSRRIRLGSLRGALTSARARARSTGQGALPSVESLPPPTLWPPVPTFQRRVRRRPGTTHDPDRGGGARLTLARERIGPGDGRSVFWLTDQMTIGSDPSCDVVLEGLEPVHVRIIHDDQDEWIVQAVDGWPRVHGERVTDRALRTGARLDLGPHHLAYHREEFADHGRPHGGRIGGELGRQLPQPTRQEMAERRAEQDRPADGDQDLPT